MIRSFADNRLSVGVTPLAQCGHDHFVAKLDAILDELQDRCRGSKSIDYAHVCQVLLSFVLHSGLAKEKAWLSR